MAHMTGYSVGTLLLESPGHRKFLAWLVFFLAVPRFATEITGVSIETVPGFEPNMLTEASRAIKDGKGSIGEVCTMSPKKFLPGVDFYALECCNSAGAVNLRLSGESIFWVTDGTRVPEVVQVNLPTPDTPQIKNILSCPDGVEEAKADRCKQVTIDIVRRSSDLPFLMRLDVRSVSARHLAPPFNEGPSLQPTFKHDVFEYVLQNIQQNQAFSIMATAKNPARVGIEYDEGQFQANSGVPPNTRCDEGGASVGEWKLPGFPIAGKRKYHICASHNNDQVVKYSLTVNVTQNFSTSLKSVKLHAAVVTDKSKTANLTMDDFNPTRKIYVIFINEECFKDKVKVSFDMETEDEFARLHLSGNWDTNESKATGKISASSTTLDNSKLHHPNWKRNVNVDVTSQDNRKVTYRFTIIQKASSYSKLKNILTKRTNCTLERQGCTKANKTNCFSPDQTDYSCMFDYMGLEEFGWDAVADDGETEIVVVNDDEKCADCLIRVPDPLEDPKKHLSVDFESWNEDKQKLWPELRDKRGEDNIAWRRKFLYGEYHVLPIRVIAPDRTTTTTYNIYIERVAPWYIRVQTQRALSTFSMTVSGVMSVTGAATVMALAKQVQFMALTTEIESVPSVYKEFATNLKAINLDISDYLPDFGMPSKEDFERFKEQKLAEVQKALRVDDLDLLRLIVQYCYAKEVFGLVHANSILAFHHNDVKKMYETLEEIEAFGGGKNSTNVTEDRRLMPVEPISTTAVRTMLRGTGMKPDDLRQSSLWGSWDSPVSPTSAGHHPRPRRLDDDKNKPSENSTADEEKDEEEEEEEEDAEYEDVWLWSDEQWEEFVKEQVEKKGVKADTYEPIKVCHENTLMHDIEMVLKLQHSLMQVSHMIHSTAGSFLMTAVGIFAGGGLYGLYFVLVMLGNQKRAKALEPVELWIFICDYALVAFSKSSAKLLFHHTLVSFWVWKPQRWCVKTACLLAIILYPLAFLMFALVMVWKLTRRGAGGQKSKLVFNNRQEQWMDPACHDAKVTIESKVPSSIPLLPKLTTRHIRSCIPILDIEGDRLVFDDNVEELEQEHKARKSQTVQAMGMRRTQIRNEKQVVQKEMARMDEAIQNELAEISTDHLTKQRKNREAQLRADRDHSLKIEKWNEEHKEIIRQRLDNLERRSSQAEAVSRPPWFQVVANKEHLGQPATQGNSNASLDENYDTISLVKIIKKWESKKHRDDNEVLDSEEKFAILHYMQTHRREEKRLLKYNIFKLDLHYGLLKPREPIKAPRILEVDEAKTKWGLSFESKRDGQPLIVSDVSKNSWGDRQLLLKGNEIIEVNGRNTLDKSSADAVFSGLNPPFILKINWGAANGDSGIGTWWLPEKSDYLEHDLTERGHHPWLDEFSGTGNPFFENSLGERLVYKGDSTSYLSLGWLKTGKGIAAGECKWMGEPDEGWKVWEEHNRTNETSICYADKWQYIMKDMYDSPWDMDEEDEEKVKLFGLEKCSFKKESIPFFKEGRKYIRLHYRNSVPAKVTATDKIEIRKWMWTKLQVPMEIKVKAGFLADQHPKFSRGWSLEHLVATSFHELMLAVETAKPNAVWTAEFGAGEYSKEGRPTAQQKQPQKQQRKQAQQQKQPQQQEGQETAVTLHNQHELLEYMLMKIEDQFAFDEEPWWKEDDAELKKHGEIKVMFNQDLFWKNCGDPELESIRKVNTLVPEDGYHSSNSFGKHEDEYVGKKRYDLQKPDQSITKVNCKVKLGHILPLMRFTENFKLSMPIDSLDMQYRSSWQLVIGGKKKGEQYNFVFDRVTNLLSIIVLSASFGGLIVALSFTTMKILAATNAILTSWMARSKKEEKREEANDGDSGDDEGAALLGSTEQLRNGKKVFRGLVQAAMKVDIGVLGFQIAVLLFLASAQDQLNGTSFHLQPNLAAFICILLCAFTMIFMNVFTFAGEFQKIIEEQQEYLKNLDIQRRNYWHQAKEFLSGENMLGIMFWEFEEFEATESIQKAEKIDVVVGELGITLEGEPEIDEGTPLDERRQMEMYKKMSYYTMQKADNDDESKVKSVRDIARFEKDLTPSLAVSLSIPQMMKHAKIPQMVATIQCVNHCNSKISKPMNDNYLTLCKPDDWEPEFDEDENKVNEVLDIWSSQVETWLEELGSARTEKTATDRIQQQVCSLLKRECTGSLDRDLVKLNIGSVCIPAQGLSCSMSNIEGKLGYVSVVCENEKIKKDFQPERFSKWAKFEKYTVPQPTLDEKNKLLQKLKEQKKRQEEEKKDDKGEGGDYDVIDEESIPKQHEGIALRLAVDTELMMEIPTGVTKVRFAVWVQEAGEEELVAFTSEINVVLMSEEVAEDGKHKEREAYIHTRWKHARGHGLDPFGGENEDPDEKAIRLKLKQEAEAGKGCVQRTKDRFLNCFVNCLTCNCCSRTPSDETIEASRGAITFVASTLSEEETKKELRTLTALTDVVEGDSTMTKTKLGRHTDRYLSLSKIFGVMVNEEELNDVKEHLKRMQKLENDLQKNTGPEEEKKKMVLSMGMRRQLVVPENMRKAIERLEQEIEIFGERIANRKKVDPENKIVTPFMVSLRTVSGRNAYKIDPKRVEAAKHAKALKESGSADAASECEQALLDSLVRYRLRKSKSEKAILHYLILSDHLKEGKAWRPDAIPIHLGRIVTNNVEDVPKLKLTTQGLDVQFDRILKPGSQKEPAVLNGRLVFKAASPVFQDQSDTWLYWDGQGRWVISPKYGCPVPYGLDDHKDTAKNFMWVKDESVNPGLITQTWNVWSGQADGRSMRRWEKDTSVRVLGPNHGKRLTRKRTLGALAQTGGDDGGGKEEGGIISEYLGMVTDTFGEVFDLFSRGQSVKLDRTYKDVLVGMDAKYITFAWKDHSIEKLGAFRKFLLNEFGTYQSSWLYITRHCRILRPLVEQNLVRLFNGVVRELKEDEEKGSQAAAATSTGLGWGRQAAKKRAMLESRASYKSPFTQPKKLREFLEKRRAWDKGRRLTSSRRRDEAKADEHFEQLAQKICDLLDKEPRDGEISVHEIHVLFDVEPTDALLKEFCSFLKAHPAYKNVDNFWVAVTEGYEIALEDFTDAVERLMTKFKGVKQSKALDVLEEEEGETDYAKSQSLMAKHEKLITPAAKAEHIFADLDTSLSGKVSFKELRPNSGSTFTDASKSMVRRRVQLVQIKEVHCRAPIRKSDAHSVKFVLDKPAERSEEWKELREALDPDWQLDPGNEFLEVTMDKNHYDTWKTVIQDSQMLAAQEWIRFYDGQYKEHPKISGTYMRQGRGDQRWANGQIYSGEWVNHVYHGSGSLWKDKDHFEGRKADALYAGEWERGFRHGIGTMRYEQDVHDRRGRNALTRGNLAGVKKIYEGQFRNGLFHGQGVLKMEKAVAQQLPGRSQNSLNQRPGFVPLPNLDPSFVLRYEGTFESDWKKTDETIRGDDPVFASRNPPLRYPPLDNPGGEDVEQMDYNLHELTRYQKKRKRFLQFFDVDAFKVQKAGHMIPDLAMAAYTLRGGDGMHMKQATICKYADGTIYEGQFADGKPSGEGENGKKNKTQQYEILNNGDQGPWLATYEGGFLNGERSGDGEYKTADDLFYKGQWKENKRHGKGKETAASKIQEAVGYTWYDGEWQKDLRHGTGEMGFDDGHMLFEGTFVEGKRQGQGSIYRVPEGGGEKILILRGNFQDDQPHSTPERPIWSHLVEHGHKRGRFFYGTVDAAGQRVGIGTLYDEDADKNANFMTCFHDGTAYTAENPEDHTTLKYISYHGPFKDDKPHGEGLQHFSTGDSKSRGIYIGQFQDGLRHGRGTWTSDDRKWTFRPITAQSVANWDRDNMHGIGVVEDDKHVHENVIYTHGRCQMPFTDRGPPRTGFENTVVVGTLIQKGRVSGKKKAPSASIAKSRAHGGIRKWFGFREDNAEGWNVNETQSLKRVSVASVSVANVQSNAAFRSEEDTDDGGMGIAVREETDLSLPEEDIFIKGGTGQNASINGLYFKLSSTYGMPVYKMVKKERRYGYGVPVARFLYFDVKTNVWVISVLPNQGPKELPGCAYVEDADATHPGAITAEWYVYYPTDKKMKQFGGLDEEDEDDEAAGARAKKSKAPVDQIKSVSIMGFEPIGIDKTLIKAGSMVRHGKELYGRPVYESESGGQYLYWFQKGGDLAQGLIEDDLEGDAAADPSKLFQYNGHWIIACQVGEVHGGPTCLAYLEDSAVTPDQIPQGSRWYVAVSEREPGNPEAGYRYERNSTFSFAMEECTHDTHLLGMFDEDDALIAAPDPSSAGRSSRTVLSSAR